MKSKLLALLLALLMIASALVACGGTDGNGGGDESGEGNVGDNSGNTGGSATDGYIYDKELGINPSVVYSAKEGIPSNLPDIIRSALRRVMGDYPPIIPDSYEQVAHEIVLGPTEREISAKAYRRLARFARTQEPDNVNWVIYSDGNSLAVAYDADDAFVTLEEALLYLKENIVGENTSLKGNRGVIASGSFSDIEYFKVKDDEVRQQGWQRLEAALTEKIGEVDAGDFVDAMKELYAIYDNDVVSWFANLYDPAVGGYYYSNSGRNSENYLPDIESTAQALGFWESSGMCRLFGSSYANAIPDWMADQIVKFLKGLQDPNGFFYHPQWTKELTDQKISRRARDLGNAVGVLRKLGSNPTYDTPTGNKGDGILADGTRVSAVPFVTPISTSRVAAVSKAVAVASYADHLENEATFRAYLEQTKKSKSSFYAIGNQITAEMAQIIARDKQLKDEGATYSLVDITIEFFNAHQDPETGLWGMDGKAAADYLGVNGLLKISGIYTNAKVEIHYAEKAARAAIDAISSDEKMSAVVDLYNTWYSIQNVIDNLTKYGKTVDVDGKLMSGADRARAIRESLFVEAIPAIRKSAEKIADFEKSDGSFSYGRLYSATTSQGMPVALPNSNEGDVNATVIAVNGIKNHIYEALGLNGYKVILFGEAERRMYVDILEELGPVIKYQSEIKIDDPNNFDTDDVGSESPFIEVTKKSDGKILVQKDPRGTGNVLVFDSNPADVGDSIMINNNIYFPKRNQYVFEGEFNVTKENNSGGTVMQVFVGRAAMLFFDVDVKAGTVDVCYSTYNGWKSMKTTHLSTFKLDEWFKARVEYYPVVDDDVRIKVFINDKLMLVTNDYYGKFASDTPKPVADVTYTQIFALSGADVTVMLDNLHTYNTDETYLPSEDKTLLKNVDLELPKEELDFEVSESLPTSLTVTGNVSVAKNGSNSVMKLGAGSVAKKVNQVDIAANTAILTAKLSASAMAEDDFIEIVLMEDYRAAVAAQLKLVRTAGGVDLLDGKSGSKIASLAVVEGKELSVEISYSAGKINVSVDGEKKASLDTSLQYFKIYEIDTVKLTYDGTGTVEIDGFGFNSYKK